MVPMTASLIAPIVSLLMQSVTSSLKNVTIGKGVMRTGEKQENRYFFIVSITFNDERFGKKSQKSI